MKKFILFYRENTQRLEFTLLYFIRVFKGCCLSSSFQGIKLNKNFIFYVAFLLSLFSQSLIYSQITIDGNPNDWPAVLNNPANTKKAFKHDPFDILHIDDQWTGGSSDTDVNPSLNWFWVKGNSNDKGDVANAGAVLLGTKLYFFGDRTATNGDAQIGFWFFLDNVQPIGTGDRSSPFTGQHTNGDILIISNFVNGGGKAKPLVYVWTGKTSTLPGGLVLANPAVIDAILGTNPALVNVPTGQMYNGETWSFYPKFGTSGTYPSPLFFEGYVDLATLPGGYNACFQRFLLETRNSQSLNASLQDLVSGGFSGVPPAPSVASNSICGNGSVSLTASGCNNGILKWYSVPSGGSPIGVGTPFNTPIINQTTTYYVSCTIDGCEGPRSPVVATINLPPTGIGVPTHVLCNGASTGSIDLTPSGGIPPYTYAWTKVGDVGFNASTQDLSGLSAGVYNVVITDSKGCDANTQVEITEPPLLLPDISKNPFNVGTLCGVNSTEAQANVNTAFNNWLNEAGPGYENGVLVTNPGTAPYVITREPVNPSAPLFSGGVTQVTWTITDACGKTDVVTETFTVNNNCRIICETIATPVVCYGDSSGSLAVTGSGGFPPYNFYLYLSSDLTTQISSVLGVNANPGMTTFSDLPTGNYTILITDSVQNLDDPTICPDTFISEPTALDYTIEAEHIFCNGASTGSIDLTPSGGIPPYTYAWTKVGDVGFNASTQDLSGLSAGVYNVVITDSKGCDANTQVEITEPPLLLPDISKNPFNVGTLCGVNSTEAQANVNTAFNNWLNEAGPGYENGVLVTNPGTAPYVITREPVNPSAPLFSGGVTQVTWTITDACGKTDVVTETFTVNNNCRIICETIATPVVCYGDSSGSLAVTGSGGFPPYNFYLYLSSDLTTQISSVLGVNANPGMTTFSDLPTGNYTILITDSVQNLDDPTICPDTFISEPTALELTLVTNSENCSGPGSGSIEATFSGGTPPYLVSINGESATEQSSPYTFNNLSSGGYSINVVDANGCEKFLETKVNLMPCNDAHCTYTQGFYGNVGGLGCTPNYGTVNSQIMMINALNQVGGSYNFGSVITGNYFLLKLSDINGSVKPKDNNIYKMLPGGGTPRALFGFATYDTFSTWSDNDPLNSSGNKKGAINNNLLSQTMTLFFNMQVDPTLGGTQLQANFATAAAVQCGSNIPNMETIQYFTISQNIINYLNLNGGANIANLFNLANKILGGETVVGITASNVNAAVDSINKGYDECRINVTQNLINIVDNTFVKDNNIKLLKSDFVVYPVPFKDNINIKYLFDSDSVVEIQIFDMKGALVFKYKDSEVYSGKEVNLNLPFKHAGGEIYFIKMITNQETIIKKIVSNN